METEQPRIHSITPLPARWLTPIQGALKTSTVHKSWCIGRVMFIATGSIILVLFCYTDFQIPALRLMWGSLHHDKHADMLLSLRTPDLPIMIPRSIIEKHVITVGTALELMPIRIHKLELVWLEKYTIIHILRKDRTTWTIAAYSYRYELISHHTSSGHSVWQAYTYRNTRHWDGNLDLYTTASIQ